MTTETQALTTISAELLEQVVVGGDLSRLTPPQRLEWYRHRCEAAGLDVRTQPLQYLTLQGKLVLYATKSAADQLIANHRLSVEIVDRRTEGDLYEVTARVRRPDGSTVDDVGYVPIGGLKGDAACNARLKAITKAKRRAVLSACGLGVLDETETETIRGAQRLPLEQAHALVVEPPRPALPPAAQPLPEPVVVRDPPTVEPQASAPPPRKPSVSASLADLRQRLGACASKSQVKVVGETWSAWLERLEGRDAQEIFVLNRDGGRLVGARLDEIALGNVGAAMQAAAQPPRAGRPMGGGDGD